MKISELIKHLKELQKEYGDDIPVIVHDGMNPSDLEEVTSLEPGMWDFYESKDESIGDFLPQTRAIRLS